jgi:peptidoglycan/xylan/chitin deacetylase (PgdA/CDA1 family)
MNNDHHRAALTMLTLAHPLPALAAVMPAMRRTLGVRDRLDDRGRVALTFDDGPGAEGTPAVLDALAAQGVTATFFVTGEQVRDHPAIARDIVAGGHAVGVHGDRHRNLLRVGPRALRRDLDRAAASIADLTGVVPILYRPPYGVLNATALAVCRERSWEPVLWSRWGRDWRARATPAGVAREVTRDLAGGEILLLHDADRYSAPGSWRTTLAALPAIVAAVRTRGLDFGHPPPRPVRAVQAAVRVAGPPCRRT